jgi:hypothetical protein
MSWEARWYLCTLPVNDYVELWKCGYSRPGKLEVSHSKVIDGAGISCLKAERCCGCLGEDVPALLKASEEVSSAFLSV